MEVNDITEIFDNIPEGGHFKSNKNFSETFIKPEQDDDYHLEKMVISLDFGSIIHFSRVIDSEVHWGMREDHGFPHLIKLKD